MGCSSSGDSSMTVTKPYVDRYTQRLYRFLADGHKISFRKMRNSRGHVYTNIFPTEIWLDPRDEIISTLVHETLHYFYPEASEAWILRMESKIVAKLTPRQVRNILCRLADNISN
jgi:hypothetical protein